MGALTRAGSGAARLRVFISYSRVDNAFAEELVAGLEAAGFDPFLDKHDIAAGEDWEDRLGRLIESSDTVVFVISPDAVDSPRCKWEVDRAEALSKRLLPIVWSQVPDARVPDRLKRLNYIFFDKPHSFGFSLASLAKALKTELDWIREHTRLGELAVRWSAKARADALLLRGEELAAAKAWVAHLPRDAPEPTLLHREFIAESDKAEALRFGQERARLDEIAQAQSTRAAALERAEAAQSATARSQSRAKWILSVLLLTVLGGLSVAVWQSRVTASRQVGVIASLAHRAAAEGAYETAMRISLQGLRDINASALALGGAEREISTLEAKLAGAAMLGRMQVRLKGHSDTVHQARFSPDGQRIATGSEDKSIRIWDAKTGKELRKLMGHSGPVVDVNFSPDGTKLVSASSDSTARVWDIEKGTEILQMDVSGWVLSVAFSSDGRRIVTASGDNFVRVWDAGSGRQIMQTPQHTANISNAVFSPDGSKVLMASHDKTATMWDAATGAAGITLRGQVALIRVAFSPDGRFVVAACDDGAAQIWNASTGAETRLLTGHAGVAQDAQFSPDGTRVVTASDDNSARVWDAATGAVLLQLKGHGRRVTSASFSPDNRRIVTSSADGSAQVWDATGAETVLQLTGHDDRVWSATFSPDGSRILTGAFDGTAHVWDSTTGNEILKFRADSEGVNMASYSPDGKTIVTAGAELKAYDATTGAEIAQILGHNGEVLSVVYDHRGDRIASSAQDNTARVWDAETKEQLLQLPHGNWVRSVQFSADDRLIVTSSDDSTIRVWDAETGDELHKIKARDRAFGAVFNGAGDQVLAGTADGTARIIDVASGKTVQEFVGHLGIVTSAIFSPDGNSVLTTSTDSTVRFWDVASGVEIVQLAGHRGYVRRAAFSPGGDRLVTASSDRSARVWNVGWVTLVKRDDLPRRVCAEKLSSAAEFSVFETADPLLAGFAGIDTCSPARSFLAWPFTRGSHAGTTGKAADAHAQANN